MQRNETFVCFGIALFVSILAILVTGTTLTWMALSVLLVGAFAVVPLIAYAKYNLSFFFLCVYAFVLPVDISKALSLGTLADGSQIIKFISLADIISVLMIISWIVERMQHRFRGRIYVGGIIIPFLCMFFWSQLSLINALKVHLGLTFITTYMKWFGIIICVANILNSIKRIKVVVFILMMGIVFQSGYVFLQTVFGSVLEIQGQKITPTGRYLFFGSSFKQLLRPAGTLQHPNVFASYMVLFLPMLFGIILAKAKFLEKIPFYGTLVAGTAALILSYSRGGWASFALALCVIVCVGGVRKLISTKTIISLGLTFLIVALALFPFWKPVLWRITKSDDQSTNMRIAMTKQSYYMIKAHPFLGVGLGNYYQASKDYIPPEAMKLDIVMRLYLKAAIVHNKFLSIAGETGLVGLFFFFWLLWVITRYAYQNLSSYEPYLQYLSLGLFGSLAGSYLNMVLDHYQDNTRNIMFWFVVSLILAVRVLNAKQKEKKKRENGTA